MTGGPTVQMMTIAQRHEMCRIGRRALAHARLVLDVVQRDAPAAGARVLAQRHGYAAGVPL